MLRLALLIEGNLPFLFCLLCIWGQFPSTSPRGAYIWRGNLTEGFLRYKFGQAYTWRGLFSEFYGIVMFCSFVIETVITSHELFSASSLLLIVLKLFIDSPK